MQDRSILRDIDFVSPEHGFDAVSKAGFLGELDEKLERLVGDSILGVIQEESRGFRRHPFAALRVFRKELTEM
jgi:hypothetical protein